MPPEKLPANIVGMPTVRKNNAARFLSIQHQKPVFGERDLDHLKRKEFCFKKMRVKIYGGIRPKRKKRKTDSKICPPQQQKQVTDKISQHFFFLM